MSNNVKFTDKELGLIASLFGATNERDIPGSKKVYHKAAGAIGIDNYRPVESFRTEYQNEENNPH